MQEIFEKIKKMFKEKRDKYENLADGSNFDGYYEEELKYFGMQEAYEEAIEIVNQVADEYVPEINVGEIEEFCEWKIDGVYLHCQHDMKIVISCLEDEEYRYNFCPYCGKKIKVVE